MVLLMSHPVVRSTVVPVVMAGLLAEPIRRDYMRLVLMILQQGGDSRHAARYGLFGDKSKQNHLREQRDPIEPNGGHRCSSTPWACGGLGLGGGAVGCSTPSILKGEPSALLALLSSAPSLVMCSARSRTPDSRRGRNPMIA